MIANYVNEQHDTWDQFLRELAYAILTAVNETTGKNPAELFLGRKLITPFQKLVMVSDGTEFAKEKPKRRNSNAHHKRLQPQTTNWKKSGVPTDHSFLPAKTVSHLKTGGTFNCSAHFKLEYRKNGQRGNVLVGMVGCRALRHQNVRDCRAFSNVRQKRSLLSE
ncbi:uncharacterized protein TNCV_820371 [Trichonephila clavipes]|nr:uncharacterized protein TNCV_820371 [Trichonephila clavipes]